MATLRWRTRPTVAQRLQEPERCRRMFGAIIGPVRARAQELGYAIGVHGSLCRDIDLIAVPWTRQAVGAKELAEAIRAAAAEALGGWVWMDQLEAKDEWFQNGCQPYGKPHGRMCWSFHLGGGPYIDLSVMPRDAGDEEREDVID